MLKVWEDRVVKMLREILKQRDSWGHHAEMRELLEEYDAENPPKIEVKTPRQK